LVATGEEWTPHPQLRNLPPGEIDLSPLDAALHPQIRLRAQLADPSAKLAGWSADFAPRPSLELSAAHSTLGSDGLHLELQVRNLGAATDDARIIIQLNGHQTPLRELALGHLTRGETRQVLFDSLGTPPAHTRLFATIITDQPDANPDDNRLEIPLFFSGHIPLSLALWPETGTFISGDPLRPGQGLVIDVPNLANPRIELLVDDQPVDADSTLDAFPAPPRLLWRPDANLSPGRHRLETRIFSGDEEIGRRKITFRYGESLHIANALVYPHPVRRATAFTYMLSGSAEVEIEIYALTGRLIRRLGPITQEPGFQQMHWDGRDQSTAPLANGTYLYRIIATNTERTVVFRAPLVIAR
ncbi:MAG: FlgD immunoglobulin-like domain containing protein, partial [Candidatus Latescibacterota bacterium]